MTLTGRCLCGAIRYEVRGTPRRMVYCHCEHCRRASGSSFATNVLVDPDDLSVVAGAEHIGTYESRPGKLRHFCTVCGSPLYNRMADGSGLVPVRAGTLDGDPGIRPSRHIWYRSRAPWVRVADGLPRHERGPDSPEDGGSD